MRLEPMLLSLFMGEIVHTHRYEKSKSKHADELAKERAGNTRALRMRNEMLLAKARNELITKELVLKQAAYLLIAMRQKLLGVPQTYSRRLLNISDQREMAARLKEMALSVLNEVKDLPSRVTDPNWLSKLEEDTAWALLTPLFQTPSLG
jgi:hypothetical protein